MTLFRHFLRLTWENMTRYYTCVCFQIVWQSVGMGQFCPHGLAALLSARSLGLPIRQAINLPWTGKVISSVVSAWRLQGICKHPYSTEYYPAHLTAYLTNQQPDHHASGRHRTSPKDSATQLFVYVRLCAIFIHRMHAFPQTSILAIRLISHFNCNPNLILHRQLLVSLFALIKSLKI